MSQVAKHLSKLGTVLFFNMFIILKILIRTLTFIVLLNGMANLEDKTKLNSHIHKIKLNPIRWYMYKKTAYSHYKQCS